MKKLMLLLALLGSQAHATIVSADFIATSDCASCSYRQGPLTLTALGQSVGTGVELGAGATLDNPSNFYGGIVYADLDPDAKTLRLFSQDDNDFESFTFELRNVQFSGKEIITGLSVMSDDLTEFDVITPTWTVSNNSLLITYASDNGFYFRNGSAVFQLTTEEMQGEVPEPAGAALFALGLAGLLSRRKTRP